MVPILSPGSFSVIQDWFYSFKFVRNEFRSPPRFCLRSFSVLPLHNTLDQVIWNILKLNTTFMLTTSSCLFTYPLMIFSSLLNHLKSCLNDIQVWMSENKLKLSLDKTEFIVFGAKDRYKWLSDSFPVNILGSCLSPTDVAPNLGVLFDAKFCFTSHVNSVIKSCFISLRDLHCIVSFL